jgi:hypothetical protein
MELKVSFDKSKMILSKKNEGDVIDNIEKGVLPKTSLIHSPVTFLSEKEMTVMEEVEI